jgi:hypothetical protein
MEEAVSILQHAWIEIATQVLEYVLDSQLAHLVPIMKSVTQV